MNTKAFGWFFLCAILMMLGVPQTGWSQATPGMAAQSDTEPLWDDLMHYALIGKWDLAKGYGQALLDSQPDPVVLFRLAESDRYADAYRTLGLLQADSPLKAIADEILKRVELGRYQVRTDRDRIVDEVKRLSGTTRGRMMAVERLKDSGEWSIPVLIEALRDPARGEEVSVIRWGMPQVGKDAVGPLVVVLQGCREVSIRLVVLETLGKIGYRQAAPYIQEIFQDPSVGTELKAAALSALQAIWRDDAAPVAPAAVLFEELAEQYYRHTPSLAPPANQAQATLWFWDEQKGLYFELVDRGAFNNLMAMRSCEQALRLNANLPRAIALWLSAFFRLEIDGYPQPKYFGDHHADAATYALMAGPEYLHRVLSRAMENRDRALALAAIGVLQRNSGQQSLLYELQAQQPLVEALSYPDREVRFRAALAIGGALPDKPFRQNEQVVPVLAEALQQKGVNHALVVDADTDRRNRLVAELRAQGGFGEVIGESNFAIAVQQIKRFPSLELIVLHDALVNPGLSQALEMIQRDYRLAFVPTVILAEPATQARDRQLQADKPFVETLMVNTPVKDMIAMAGQIWTRNKVEAMAPDRADEYATQAVTVLRSLVSVRQTILSLKPAESVLLAAIHDGRPLIEQLAVETLAHLDSMDAQRAVANLVLDPALSMDVRLHALQNLTISAKAFGNMLSSEQVEGLYTIICAQDADPTLRTTCAQAYGALNLPSARISQMILNQIYGLKGN